MYILLQKICLNYNQQVNLLQDLEIYNVLCNYNLEAFCHLKWIYLYIKVKLHAAKVFSLHPK